jgi:hypothetical protein
MPASRVPARTDRESDKPMIPGFSRGVRTSVGLRMIKMCRPICPNSKIEMEQDTAGNWRRIERGPDDQNCQLEGGRWWETCEARGHEPYWSVTKWYTKKDIIKPVLDDEGEETGEVFVERVVQIPHEVRRPNISQVAVAKNINNGRGPDDAIRRKGFKYLGTLGFQECCQYRNCQKEVDERYVIDGLGRYCSQQHLELVVVTHAQDDGAEAIRLVDAGFHREGTRKQSMLRRREFAQTMQDAESVYGQGGE